MANFYPDELISEVVNANDIISLVSSYVQLKKSGSGYMGCCPFHREKTPSFHVSSDKQLYHCFGCGAGGSVIQFAMAAENLDFPDAVKFLAERAGISLPEMGQSKDEADEFYKRKRRIYDMNRDAAKFFREVLLSPAGKKSLDYLTKRGLSMKTITAFGLGASADSWDALLKKLTSLGYERDLMVEAGLCVRNEKNHIYDRYRNRVMFPIIDVRGNVVGFGGRKLEGDGAKYINSPESIVYNKSKVLYALNFAKKSTSDYLILTEGYMDVISLHQAGFTGAIAGCGTALTLEQARLAVKHSKKIYLCYDSDEAGQKAAKKAIELFSNMECSVKILKVPDGKDPDEFIRKRGAEAFEKLITSASATTRYSIDTIMDKYDLDDIAQKVEFSREAAVFLSKLKSAVEQDEYIKYISLKAHISADALNAEIKKLRRNDRNRQLSTEMRKNVTVNTPTVQKKSQGRLNRAECGLLSTLLSSRLCFEKLKDKITEETFTNEFHCEVFQKALELYNSGAAFGITELAAYFPGREGEFSAVFLQTAEIADPIQAAVDYIKVIEEETLNLRIAEATRSGDVNLLSELLKKQKSLKG
ncbi:MAG: DNA primase [Clostridia bacterium]|nr:DNA primase [Clostridia bacterium]